MRHTLFQIPVCLILAIQRSCLQFFLGRFSFFPSGYIPRQFPAAIRSLEVSSGPRYPVPGSAEACSPKNPSESPASGTAGNHGRARSSHGQTGLHDISGTQDQDGQEDLEHATYTGNRVSEVPSSEVFPVLCRHSGSPPSSGFWWQDRQYRSPGSPREDRLMLP